MSEDRDYNIILLGARGVGKSSFVKRISDDTFTDKYTITDGIDILNQDDSAIWDISSSMKDEALRAILYSKADEALIFADASSPSFAQTVVLKRYLSSFRDYSNLKVTIIIGKIDIGMEKTIHEIERFCTREKLPFIKVSSKMEKISYP